MLNKNFPQTTATPLEPVQPTERILALDVVRGCALFGVLLAYALWNLGSPPANTYSQADRLVDRALTALVDNKCYTLLATLFGLGFSMQLARAEARGAGGVTVYCRRLLALLLIGLGHALLLRNGDILVPYAAMGFVLLLFRQASNRALAIGAATTLLLPYAIRIAWMLTGLPFPQRPETTGLGHLAGNVAWVRYWYSTAIVVWPGSLPMFLCGFYLGRLRIFENIGAHRRLLRRTLIAGLALGILAFAGFEVLDRAVANRPPSFALSMMSRLFWHAHAWGMAAFYASSLFLLSQRNAWQQWLAPLGAVGRMALTNYLLQSVLLVPVCIALNLFDRVTPTLGLLMALGVWALQVPGSVWWLKRFQFGPAEWVWRRLTYGRTQPMPLVDERAAAAGGFK